MTYGARGRHPNCKSVLDRPGIFPDEMRCVDCGRWGGAVQPSTLVEFICYIPLVEAEANYCQLLASQITATATSLKPNSLDETRSSSCCTALLVLNA